MSNTYSVNLRLGTLQKYREVTVADSADVLDPHEGINFHGYQAALIDVAALGGGNMATAPITVQPLFWSEAAAKYVVDLGFPARQFAAPGQYVVDGVHNRKMTVAVTAFAGGYSARISLAPAKPELTQD